MKIVIAATTPKRGDALKRNGLNKNSKIAEPKKRIKMVVPYKPAGLSPLSYIHPSRIAAEMKETRWMVSTKMNHLQIQGTGCFSIFACIFSLKDAVSDGPLFYL